MSLRGGNENTDLLWEVLNTSREGNTVGFLESLALCLERCLHT